VSEPVARLIEIHSDAPGRAHELGVGKYVLGRDASADLSFAHADISRQHAELTVLPDGAEIRDLGSKNGVVVDGLRLEQAVLAHGSRLAFGAFELLLEHHGERVDRLLANSGELTVRRPSVQDATRTNLGPPVPVPRSVLLPVVAVVVFAALLIALLVFG
jgi:pSer/pThr/pTyr-binding forkhead associated (FHA) protein